MKCDPEGGREVVEGKSWPAWRAGGRKKKGRKSHNGEGEKKDG